MAYDLNLYYYLKRNLRVCYKTSIGDETRIRCPFCGDSRKDPNAARLYIKNEAPFKFYCFNCNASGVVDDRFMNTLTTSESSYEIMQYVKQKKEESRKSSNFKTTKINNIKYFSQKLDFSVSNPRYLKKLDYLNERLGINLTENDLEKFKIVLNIQDFFVKNGLDIKKRFTQKREQELFMKIREHYIGFLSSDRNVIIFRNTDPNCDKNERFANIRVFLLEDYETKKTYNIGTDIDIYKPNYNIVITEGIIDIIGVYHHLYQNGEDLSNYIFLANCGKSYATTLHFINSLSLLDNNITIYSDADVGIDLYRKLKKNSPEFRMNPITVYYNTKAKDYGVRKDMIELSSKIIL